MAPKDVLYGIEVVGTLPQAETRASVLEDAVSQIKADPSMVGQAIIIARYRNRTAASAAANTLRKRHGQPEAEGLKFECHRIEDRSALFVVFNPEWVTPEGVAQHAADLEADRAKKAEQARDRRAAKQADKASGSKGKTEKAA